MGFSLALAICLLLCSAFITVEPIDADTLEDYAVFSLDEEAMALPSFKGESAPEPVTEVTAPAVDEIVPTEMPVYTEVLQDDLQEIDEILEEIARKKAEEARRRAEEAAARNAAEEKATQEAIQAGAVPSRDFSYTIRDVDGYSELEYLAAICFIEASNQYQGSLAVANVVLNRVQSSRFPDTIYDVIFQKNQFATARIFTMLSRGPYSNCLKAAEDALAGYNNIGTRCFFNATYSVSNARRQKLGDYVIVGGNLFFH